MRALTLSIVFGCSVASLAFVGEGVGEGVAHADDPAPPAATGATESVHGSDAPQAPPPSTSEAPEDSAKRHFLLGIKLYNEMDFRAATKEFEASYHDRAVAAVLYNLALAYKGNHQYAEAADVMEKFLRLGGDSITTDQRKEALDLLTEWKSLLAQLSVLAEPDSATVSVDGEPMSGMNKRLSPGPHTVEVSALGYITDRRRIDISAGTSPRLEITLKKVPTNGHVRITADPGDYATILIDDVERGGLPFDEDLPAGPHNFEIRAPGYQPHKDAMALSVGERRSMHFSLEKERPPESSFYKKWYFWTGLILVVGGAAVGAVAYTSIKPDPYVGSLGPGVFTVGR